MQASIKPGTGGETASPPPIDLPRLHADLLAIAASGLDRDARERRYLALILALTNAAGGAFFHLDAGGQIQPGQRALARQSLAIGEALLAELLAAAGAACAQDRLVVTGSSAAGSPADGIKILAAPLGSLSSRVGIGGAITLVLVLGKEPVETFTSVLALFAAALALAAPGSRPAALPAVDAAGHAALSTEPGSPAEPSGHPFSAAAARSAPPLDEALLGAVLGAPDHRHACAAIADCVSEHLGSTLR